MKRMITTAGLVALGAASVAPSFAQTTMQNQKPWSVGALLRGFYDDNYFMYPDAPAAGLEPEGSFGFDVAPNASLSLVRDQTSIDLSYMYQLRYFIDRPTPRDDHSHLANAKLTHVFNEQYSVDVRNSFAIAQEPSVIDDDGPLSTPLRSEGDNIRNAGGIAFNGRLGERFRLTLGYDNTFYDYEEDADDIDRARGTPVGFSSRSSVLDRMEHLAEVRGGFELNPRTTLGASYKYRRVEFSSDDPVLVGFAGPIPLTLPGKAFDRESHIGTLTAELRLNAQLSLDGEVGVEYTTYENALFDEEVGPFAALRGTWQYARGSGLNVGVRHGRQTTDVRTQFNATTGVGRPLADAEATTVWVSVNHAITAKLSAIAMAQFQHNVYDGGGDDSVEDIFYGGITLAYEINQHVSAEVGYSYDRLESDSDLRTFDRNRVFAGVRFRY